MMKDPIVEEVREIRDRLAAEHDYDVAAIFADLRKRQAAHGDRLVNEVPKPKGKKVAPSYGGR